MVSVSIQMLLFLFFSWKTGLGQPADDDDLLVSETSIWPNAQNDSRQNFRISFQPKRTPSDAYFDDGFENREVKFAILDKTEQQRLDEKLIVFDGSSMKMMNYDGKFMGLTMWMKSINKMLVTGYFDKNANETVFLVEEMKETKPKQQLMHRRIIFDDKINLNVFIKIGRSKKKDEVNDGSIVTVFCKAHSTKDVKPKFEGLQFLNQRIKTNQTNKEIQATFRAEKGNHLKELLCVAGGTKQSLTIKVLHAPAAVRIKPAESGSLMAGGHLRCFAVDGYPSPTVMWLTSAVPPNGDKFHRIDRTTNSSSTFILKENAPVGSVWTIRCRSANILGNFTLTVNFTVEANQTSLLSGQLLKLEERLQLQEKNQQKNLKDLLKKLQSNLETKMEKMMETMVQKIAALKGELKEDAAVQRKAVDKNTLEMAKTKKEIGASSSKAENDKLELRKADGDLMRWLEELREVTNASRRMQEDAVGRLDNLDNAMYVVGLNWFVWRIEGISGKVGNGENEYSRPFYSDGTRGYKLCLRYYMSSLFGMDLVFRLMRGDDDDRLQWPMNRTVLIEIIDEQSGVAVMSQRVSRATVAERINPANRKEAYDKPSSNRTYCSVGFSNVLGDGFYEFPKYEQIKSTAGAIRNDAMTVRCRVLPQ